ncbi:MAG TPA: hypothetical protein VMF30_13665 [Pirellulales bacterium]|nr:hypothetical protein [Pirellulales bacterium]
MEKHDQEKRQANEFAVAWRVAWWWAMSITTNIRRRSGRNHLSLMGPLAVVVFYALATNERLMFYMIPVIVISAWLQSNQEKSARRRGELTHSYYTGYPILASRFTKNELIAKGVVEPVLAICFGLFTGQWNHAFGTYFVIGGVLMAVVEAVQKIQHRYEEDSLSDALIDAQIRSAILRQR